MRLSKLVCERTKHAPQDAKILSHALLQRAGFIKQVAGGIYTMTMPCQKMSRKVQAIIREEMDKIDGQEVLFPVVMPRELWESSGRYDSIGSEMVRFKDRANHDMLLGMTHEEAAVHLAKNTVSSYTQLPFMIYQLQTKFRDEARPRGGLIRVREFTMKDAYSFHATQADLEEYYQKVYDAYYRIFRRIGLKNFIDFKSDTGMMGGNVAHEYMLLTEVGEDSLVLCKQCDYRANMEVADSVLEPIIYPSTSLENVYTDTDKSIEEVAKRLNVKANQTVKAVVYAVKGVVDEIIVAFIRGDLEVNEAKLKKALMKNVVAYDGGVTDAIVCGNIGPVNLNKNVTIIFDKSLENCSGMVIGANKEGYHCTGFEVNRDCPQKQFYDIRKTNAGEKCPICGGELRTENGIEIGNIFQLGTKYTEAMGMTVADSNGTDVTPIMGCYGIGVGRAIASIAQESNDASGLILPWSVAPWTVYICALRMDDAEVNQKATELYEKLCKAGIDTLFDDRNVGAGVKFADADLMGIPLRLVISPKSLANGEVEFTIRENKDTFRFTYEKTVEKVKEIIEENMKRYQE